MKNKNLFKKFIGFILSICILSQSTIPILANDFNNNQNELDVSSQNIDFGDGVFKPNKINIDEKNIYYKIVDKQVELTYKNAINNGETNFNKNEFRTELLYVLETENSLSNNIQMDGTWIPDIKIKNRTAAAALNVVIDAGTAIVTYLDSKDCKPNNGYLNYIL